MLQVHTENSRLRHPQITGYTGRDIHFLSPCILFLKPNHTKHRRTLRDIRKSDHRPQHSPLIIRNQLKVYRIRHMMKPRNNQRSIHKSEHSPKDHFKRPRNSRIHHRRNSRPDFPPNRPQNKMSRHHRKQKTAERHHHHRNHLRRYLPEKLLQITQSKRRQNSRKHLRLIPNHINTESPEIPIRNIVSRRSSHRISIQQLPRNQRQPQYNPQNLRSPHLLRHRPADPHRKHMENRLPNQPKKTIHTSPELTHFRQSLRTVFKQIQTVDTVSEPQNQPSDNNRRNQRSKNLRNRRYRPLQHILILFRSLLHRILRHPFHTCNRHKIIIKIRHTIPDNHLKLPRLRKTPLHRLHPFNPGNIRLPRIIQNKPHPSHTMRNRPNILLPPNQLQQFPRILIIFSHLFSSALLASTCLNKYLISLLYHTCLNKSTHL